ncbi:MAG TPA: polysaccharide deacetylase family protein [Alicyclobacillus sp.]|nr:polysaccharide deacetylase family protein [Alicyclobacillus sp.]
MAWLTVALLVMVGYTVVPTFLGRTMGIGCIKRLPPGMKLAALTFDDGPSPEYTPKILEILRAEGVRATFFVLAEKALRYPDLIKMMVGEGHDVAIHGLTHRPLWLLGPGKTRQEVVEAAKRLEDTFGVQIRWYRPPWGLLNLPAYIWSLRQHIRPVLWSNMSWDWAAKGPPAELARRMIRTMKDGAIVLLHDAGDTFGARRDAPAVVVEALPLFVEWAKENGWRLVKLSDVPRRTFRERLWNGVDRLGARLMHSQPLAGPGECLFRLGRRRYWGWPITLKNGTRLRFGDPVAEIHFDNTLLESLMKDAKNEWQLSLRYMQIGRRSLPILARAVEEDPRWRGVKVLYGLSVLSRGTDRAGFIVSPLRPRWLRRLVSRYLQGVLLGHHPEGRNRLSQGLQTLQADWIYISPETLIQLYGSRRGEKPPGAGSADERG